MRSEPRESVYNAAIDFLFPPLCIACGASVQTAPSLCESCQSAIDELSSPVCLYCERHLSGSYEQKCCDHRLPLYAFARYEPPVSECLRRLKFHGLSYIASLGAARIANRWRTPIETSQAAALVPVPLWHWRERKRGFNQSELFSQRFGDMLGLPSELLLLHRIKGGIPQSRTRAHDRKKNVEGIFETASYDGMPQHVLLVDDIVTTGATMREGVRTLEAGSVRVVACVCIGLSSEFAPS